MRRSVSAIKSEIEPNKGKSRGKRGNRASIKGRQWDPGMRRSVSSKSVISLDVYCGSFPLFIWISLSMGSLRTYFFGICSTFICVLQISLKNLVRFEIIDISMNKIIIHI